MTEDELFKDHSRDSVGGVTTWGSGPVGHGKRYLRLLTDLDLSDFKAEEHGTEMQGVPCRMRRVTSSIPCSTRTRAEVPMP